MGDRRNFSRQGQRIDDMASAEHEPITGVWNAEPPAGSRGSAPGEGVSGSSPLKL